MIFFNSVEKHSNFVIFDLENKRIMQKFRKAVQLIAVVVMKKEWLEKGCHLFKAGQERDSQQPRERSLEPSC